MDGLNETTRLQKYKKLKHLYQWEFLPKRIQVFFKKKNILKIITKQEKPWTHDPECSIVFLDLGNVWSYALTVLQSNTQSSFLEIEFPVEY